MFAVPGWSVSAAELKEQKLQSTPKASQEGKDGDQNQQNDGGNSSKNNKRKRGRDRESTKVTKSNLDEMWRRHIEGATTGGAENKDGAMSNKKRKTEKGKKVSANNTPLGTRNPTVKAETNEKTDASTSTSAPAKPGVTDKPQKKSKNKKQKGQKENNKRSGNEQATKKTDDAPAAAAAALPPPPPATAALTPLQQAMRQKLLSARFRHLNETLYTTPSERAMELFTANPELFHEYHAGFSLQVKESWPSNPVDSYISAVRVRGAIKPNNKGQLKSGVEPLPRRPHGTCTIADMGCGDAQFARALTPSAKKLNLKLLSYDLCESDQFITKADIASLPLENGSVDVTIFCLSLMGTNWVSFVEEAWRVLRGDGKGECWVSEVKSRFGKVTRRQKPAAPAGKKDKTKKKKRKNPDDEDEEEVGEEIFAEDARMSANDGDETDISAFVEVFRTRGFVLKQESVDKSNKMFVKMEFVKTRGMPPTKGKYAVTGATSKFGKKFLERDNVGSGLSPEEESKVLKPCVYKIR